MWKTMGRHCSISIENYMKVDKLQFAITVFSTDHYTTLFARHKHDTTENFRKNKSHIKVNKCWQEKDSLYVRVRKNHFAES